MAEKELGITAKAEVEDAISNLQNLIDKLGDMPDTTSSTVEIVINDTAIDTFQAEIGAMDNTLDYTVNVDSTGLDQLGADADAAAADVSGIGDAATDAATDIAGIDSTAINEAASAATSLGDNLEGAATGASGFNDEISQSGDHISALSAGLHGIVALGLGTFFTTAIQGAGDFNDTWSRLAVVMGEGGLPIEQVKDEWSDAISSMQDTTGRGAGNIRQYIISMGLAGVTSKDSIISSFSGVAGAAYITGYSIDSISSAFKRVVSTGTLGNRQLMALGLNEQDILKATGLSVEQVSEKLQGMNSDQRAAFLGMIMNSKYGADANEAYKNSWQRVIDVLGLMWSYLTRIIGGFILPIVIPVLNAVSWALKQVADWLGNLDGPLKTIMGVVITGVGGWVLLSTTLTTITGIMNMLGISLGLTTAKQVASTIAQYANTAARWLGIDSYNAEIGAAAAHATALGGSTAATDLNTAATNTGIAAKLRDVGTWISSTATRVAHAIATGAATAAQVAYSVAAGIATGAQWLLNAALSANPIGIVVLAIAALVGALIWLYQNNEWVRNGINWLWQGLQGLASFITTTVMGAINWLIGGFQSLSSGGGGGALDNVINAFKTFLMVIFPPIIPLMNLGNYISWLWTALQGFSAWITGGQLGAAFTFFSTLFTNPIGAIQQLIGYILNFAGITENAIPSAFNDAVNGAIYFISNLPDAVWDWFIKTLDRISKFAVEAFNRAKKTGENIFNGIIDSVKSIPGQMYTYGQNILQSLIDGLMDKMGPFKDILNYISDHWPHSPPKTGPLSEITEAGMRGWIGDIMGAGIDAAGNFNLTGAINPVPSISGANLPSSGLNGGNSIQVNVSLDGANINSNLDAKKVGEAVGTAAGDTLADKLGKQARNRGYLTINRMRG